MPKRDLQQSINTRPAVASGILTGATVIQVSQLAMSAPFSGDFQIIDQGRLIVGANIDFGPRVTVTDFGLFGYDVDGVNTFAAVTRPQPGYGAGDVFAGYVSGNHLLFDQSEGTLGVYTPAGAGFIASADGSLSAGDTDGAHMHWSSARRALEVRNGQDIKISLDANGDGFFDGTIYARGGRIYDRMQIDGQLLVGDVDGPGVTMGKFTRLDNGTLVESGEIVATDASNMPWFRVVAGGGTPHGGYFHLGKSGDYDGRMTFDGERLRVAEWEVNADALVAPDGNTRLDTVEGLVFRVIDDTDGGNMENIEGVQSNTLRYFRAMSFVEDGRTLPLHRLYATRRTVSTGVEANALILQAQVTENNAQGEAWFGAVSDRQARTVLRSIGGVDLSGQQVTEIDLWAYRGDGTGNPFGYRRIDLLTDVVYLPPYTGASEPAGSKPQALLMYTTASGGAYDPGQGAGLYAYASSRWLKVIGPSGVQRWGSADNYTEVDANGSMLFAGSARIRPRYRIETKTATFTASTTDFTTYYRVNTSSGAVTANLPPAANANGFTYHFKLINGANTLTVDPDGAETIDGASTWSTSTLYNGVTVISTGTAWEILK